jgi:hypothetical protein
MQKTKENRNIKVLAENNGSKDGFNIYLDFSGQREYLMYHRRNVQLYAVLKDGVVVADVRRRKPLRVSCRHAKKNGSADLYEKLGYLVSVIDSYILTREAC